eukprot:TRINITY_DN8261_c0_g1_i1.p1 TRINITY_DN8261_c0_g1~~TRINITY_DN8261_c0_g1_i1.p1  ORF type:complete len:147 (+),score=50.12 TRINITY_DN8261_c0_g1_i1:402-842(+)
MSNTKQMNRRILSTSTVALIDAEEPSYGNTQAQMYQSKQQVAFKSEREFIEYMMHNRAQEVRELLAQQISLQELFVQLSQITHEQAFMIDNIETNIEVAVSEVKKAKTEIKKASAHKDSERACACYMASAGAVLAGIITVLLAIKL